jgi:hypothetical protein
MSNELRQALEQVASRFRSLRLWAALAICWLIWSMIALGILFAISYPELARVPLPRILVPLAFLTVLSALACVFLSRRFATDPRWVARQVESRHPELATGLLAAVEAVTAAPPGPLGFLPSAVVKGALDHSRTNNWHRVVPAWKLRATKGAHWLSLGILAVSTFALVQKARTHDAHRVELLAAAAGTDLTVEPGDVEIERGSPLLVVARFAGPVPPEVTLRIESADVEENRSMTRSLEDPAFAARIESVGWNLHYLVEYNGSASRPYNVRVFDYPAVVRTDAHLLFPKYTALEEKTVEDVRHVTAVEGTDLTLRFQLNKEVVKGRLVDADGAVVDLVPSADKTGNYTASLKLTDPRKLKVELVDAEGRTNKVPTEIALNVVRNKPAIVKVSRPSRDVRVSPVEELALEGEMRDDFGVMRQGLNYSVAGRAPQDLVLEGGGSGVKALKASHLLAFESLKVEPDELVTYHFWAEDIGPDGNTRRSLGDMFFAEVRPFEEIFRQGEQPPDGSAENENQQGGQNAQQAMQLAELQKQIINGTWTVIRREIGTKPTDAFAADVKLLQESQKTAIQQANALGENLQDERSKASLKRALSSMTEAESRLGESFAGSKPQILEAALAAEQAAYQALLRLRDREFNVVRGNSRQRGGSQAGGPSQQQLQELELTDEENRYEQQRSARAPEESLSEEEQQQSELRQVMSRLRELARRQSDLNERVKELQSALEAAQDEQTRQELERQLKRLRDQEQEILRDTDELLERMESEENRDRMADAREKVEEGRQNVREAAEALEEGKLSQALTEGTRAGRTLDELREELRKESSNRFSEDMTEMRDETRQLAENQESLTEKLENEGQEQHSLRDQEGDNPVQQGLAQQGERLDQLLDRMRSMVQESEETEPQLAERLFEAARAAEEKRIAEALDAAEQLAELGVTREATEASRHAQQGLNTLREGVDRAAESVLGDETEALRLAQNQLDNLADQIDREIRQSSQQSANGAEESSSEEAQGSGRAPTNVGEPTSQEGEQPSQSDEGSQGQGTEPPDSQSQRNSPGQGGEPSRDQAKTDQGKRQGQPRESEEPGQGQGQEGQAQAGQGGGQGGQAGGGPRDGRPDGATDRLDQLMNGITGGGPAGPGGPITGEGYREWSDRMRDVEELLDNPEWQAEAARIRDRVRGSRDDYRRHSKQPDPEQLRSLVAEPLRQLRDQVADELRRRESPDSLVPIDRDPVPPQFADDVKRYYERLGSGR